MTATKLEQFRKLLRETAARVQNDAQAVDEQARAQTGGQADGGLSSAPLHLGDTGTEAYLQELNSTLLENERYLLNETLEALRRIDMGTFGRCENCGKAIPQERLEALPAARHCAQCAEALRPGPAVNLNVGRLASPGETLAPRHPTPGSEAVEEAAEQIPSSKSSRVPPVPADRQAIGTAGGGTEMGGLAGTNVNRGDPDNADLETATASSRPESNGRTGKRSGQPRAYSGRSGGAVGGTPAGKRARQ